MNLLAKLIGLLDNILCYISERWPGIRAALFIYVVLSWGVGFWIEGFFRGRFDLASCWVGVGAIGAVGLTEVGKEAAAWATYYVKSKFNTPQGQDPDTKG